MKVVINSCYGGFGLSHEAILRYAELKGIKLFWEGEGGTFDHYYTSKDMKNSAYFSYRKIKRDDPILVQVVEELNDAANGEYAELSIVEIPDDVDWTVQEYDGYEHIAEEHRTWY